MIKVLDLYCGTKSIAKAALHLGCETYTVDKTEEFNPSLCCDVLTLDTLDYSPDILWASPPCTTFSVASIGCHWKGGKGAYEPKTQACLTGLQILDKTVELISVLKPKVWFIENPRGVMRKVIDPIFAKYGLTNTRKTVTYCQYGDDRMKPTDIWTNCTSWEGKPMCKNGDTCHTPAPRGSRTGTQGLKGARERSIIPPALCLEVMSSAIQFIKENPND